MPECTDYPVGMADLTPLLVVMGVSGSGKTTVGEALATRLAVRFEDADSLHSLSNIAKMASGIALTDDDRMPWLASVGADLAAAEGQGLVMACSALKRIYREAILAAAPTVQYVYLEVSTKVLENRMAHREGHYMPESLLASQLATLEPLSPDEPGLSVPLAAAETPQRLVERIIAGLEARA